MRAFWRSVFRKVESKKDKNRGDVLSKLEPEDLLKFGIIPELIGRLPVVTTLDSLNEEALSSILTVPRNALTKQYATLLSVDKIDLKFSDDAIEEIAMLCVEMNATQEDIGARRLHTIMENLLEDISFNADGTHPVIPLTIDKKYVDEHLAEIISRRNLKKFIL